MGFFVLKVDEAHFYKGGHLALDIERAWLYLIMPNPIFFQVRMSFSCWLVRRTYNLQFFCLI